MSTDMAFDDIESKEIKELEAKTTTVVGPLKLMEKLNQLVTNREEGPHDDFYIKYVLERQQSLIRVNLKDPISIWYCDTNLRPAPPKVKEIITTFLTENGSNKDQYQDMYKNQRKIRVAASETGVALPLPPDPEAYAYLVLARATREKPAYAENLQVSKMGFFGQGGKAQTGPIEKTIEKEQEKPKTSGMKGPF